LNLFFSSSTSFLRGLKDRITESMNVILVGEESAGIQTFKALARAWITEFESEKQQI